MRAVLTLAASAFALMAFAPVSVGGSVDPDFVRDEPSRAVMELFQMEEGRWHFAISAGGVPNGAATAADCEIQARGPQDLDGVIHARPTPFTSPTNEMTAADIGSEPPVIEVRVGPEGVFVSDSGAAARYCGMGSDISGFYRRTDTPD